MAANEQDCLCDDPGSQLPHPQPDAAYYDYYISSIMRKNAPNKIEDSEALQKILEEFDELDMPVTVHEYVTFVGPYTNDQGIVMRNVMEEDLQKFEKLQNEVYKPLLDSTAEVLMNEDMQRAKKYADEEEALNAKILEMVSEIYRMVPNFDFKSFFANPLKYLEEALPFPDDDNASQGSDTDIKIQGLYHRYKWMETELTRLAYENREMEEKLKELKVELKKQRAKTSKTIDAADSKRQCLIFKEAELKKQLDKSNKKLQELMAKEQGLNREMLTEATWNLARKVRAQKEQDKKDVENIEKETTSDDEDDDECLCSEDEGNTSN